MSRRLLQVLLPTLLCLFSTGCLSTRAYVDPALPQVDRADLPAAGVLRDVQILPEFRSKGVANAAATDLLKTRAMSVAAESGLFAQVSSQHSPGAAQLHLVIDNVPVTDNAMAKGVGTGLTFGLAGSLVTDGYKATASYTTGQQQHTARLDHAIHTTIGNKAGPEGLAPMQLADAVNTMIDQVVWNLLKQLSGQGAFDEAAP